MSDIMDTSSSSAHEILGSMVDATPAQFDSARQCSTFDEDLQDDPFTQALDKVLGLDEETIGKDDDDVIFDELSFSEEVFEDMAREQEQNETNIEQQEHNSFDLMASVSEPESEPSPSTQGSNEEANVNEEEEDKKPEASAVASSNATSPSTSKTGRANKKKSNSKSKKQPEFKIVLPDGVEDMQKPKRCMSAYNFFFKAERSKLLAELPAPGVKPRRSHGKMGFAAMARHISGKWKKITDDEKMEYDQLAAIDGERYENEMFEYKKWKRDNNIDELTKKQQAEFDQRKLEQEAEAALAADASAEDANNKDTKKKGSKSSPKKPTKSKKAPARRSTRKLTHEVSIEVSESHVVKQDDASCDSSLASDDQEQEETILNKVDFDLLTFSEMLEDTSFVAGDTKSSPAKVSDESTVATSKSNEDGITDDEPDVKVASSPGEEESKKKPLDAQELQELKREAKMKAKKEKKKKATNRPAKSLSAYNIFFKTERKKLLESLPAPGVKPRRSHGKMGFAEMAKHIASKWKNITAEEKMYYEHLSALDSERYEREVEACKKQEEAEKLEKEQVEAVGNRTPTMMPHGAASTARMMTHAGPTPVTPIPQGMRIVQPIYIRQYVPVPAYYPAAPHMMQHPLRPGMSQPPSDSGDVSSFLRSSLCRR